MMAVEGYTLRPFDELDRAYGCPICCSGSEKMGHSTRLSTQVWEARVTHALISWSPLKTAAEICLPSASSQILLSLFRSYESSPVAPWISTRLGHSSTLPVA